MSDQPTTLFAAVGGEPFFVSLINHFYAGVDTDPVIRHMYPADLTESKAHMVGFLIQYWGGPGTYSEQRGHPRLRMRHAPFAIGEAERDAWLGHMNAAVAAMEDSAPSGVGDAMREYFANAANHMINTAG